MIKQITIERAACLYCDRRFAYSPLSEIERHMQIPVEIPLRTGFVYISQQDYNIITPLGRLMTGFEFGGHMTHRYNHQIASAEINDNKRLEFCPNLKIRRPMELVNRLKRGQITVPRLTEIARLQEAFKKYKNVLETDRKSDAWNALKNLSPEELCRIPF